MTPKEFRKAVDRGMGRAAQCLIERDPAPYIPELVAACVQDGRWDWQEERRASYLLRLATLAGAEERVLNAVLDALPGCEYQDDGNQLLDLLREFAVYGSLRAKSALLAQALKHDDAVSRVAAFGPKGLRWLIEVRPELFTVDRKDHAWWWFHLAEEASSKEAVEAVLTPAAKAARDAWWTQGAKAVELPTALTSNELAAMFKDPAFASSRRTLARRFGRSAPLEERERLARRMLTMTGPNRLWDLSAAFEDNPWPLDPEPLLSRVDGDDRASRAWRQIVKRIRHPRIREFALERVNQDPPDGDSIEFLRLNFEPGDETVILRTIRGMDLTDLDRVHSRGLDIQKLAQEVGVERFLPHLEWLIENGPCSFCRAFVFRDLANAGVLSDAYRREAAYDAEAMARELAAT